MSFSIQFVGFFSCCELNACSIHKQLSIHALARGLRYCSKCSVSTLICTMFSSG